MKSSTVRCIAAVAAFAALATSSLLLAQETRYKLVDLGTLGGPASYQSGFGDGEQILNDRGIAAAIASTSTPDPNCAGEPDCFMSHAFRWQKGVLTDLGVLPGGNNSGVSAINAQGWVVGGSEIGPIDPLTGSHAGHAVLWKNGEMIDLGTLGTGIESNAVYVKNGGQVVGYSTINTTFDPFGFPASFHPFIWKNGVMQDLGTLGGPDAGFVAGGVGCKNENEDLVAGASLLDSTPNPSTGSPTMHAFLWERGTMQDIPTLGGTYAFAQCSNNRGQVIGQSNLAGDVGCDGSATDGSCYQHVFLWDHGTLSDLGTLGADFAIAYWLNDGGEAVGGSATTEFLEFHATLWRDGRISDLGAPDEDCFSNAFAVNSRHQIVGRSFSCDGSILRAVLWDKGLAIDLNTRIPADSSLVLVEANDINDRGEIFGRGLPEGCDDENQCGHDFVLIPCGPGDAQGCGRNSGIRAKPEGIAARPATSVQSRELAKAFVAKLRARMDHRHRFPAFWASRD